MRSVSNGGLSERPPMPSFQGAVREDLPKVTHFAGGGGRSQTQHALCLLSGLLLSSPRSASLFPVVCLKKKKKLLSVPPSEPNPSLSSSPFLHQPPPPGPPSRSAGPLPAPGSVGTEDFMAVFSHSICFTRDPSSSTQSSSSCLQPHH